MNYIKLSTRYFAQPRNYATPPTSPGNRAKCPHPLGFCLSTFIIVAKKFFMSTPFLFFNHL
nr:MAG TPA: hypothetical protein [Caudoviricetes sp.]